MGKIDFLPPKYARYTQIRRVMLILILLVVSYGGYTTIQARVIKKGVSASEYNLKQVKEETQELVMERNELERELQESFLFNKLEGDFNNMPKFKSEETFEYSKFLLFLGSIRNTEVYITSITFEGGDIHLHGQGKDYMKLLEFINEIEEENIMYNIGIANVEPVIESDVLIFEIVCKTQQGVKESEDGEDISESTTSTETSEVE